VASRVIVDTSVYVAVLRDVEFGGAFRSRYERAIPRTHLSSVVVQELLAGARTPVHRRLAEGLIAPFERAHRVVTPTHAIWRDAGAVLGALWRNAASYRSAIHGGLVNDVLIALSARAIGAVVITRNAAHFTMIRSVRAFALELV
jgi:predicted nucleic acid-binding protein